MRAYGFFKSDFMILHIPNEHKQTGSKVRDIAYLKHLVAMGMLPGAADYIVIYEGARVAAIEFKRDKAGTKIKGNQLVFKEHADKLGIPYLCTYDIDLAIEFLTKLLNKNENLDA